MKPYYSEDGITIYHGDCRDVMQGLLASSVNCVITSPPYDAGKEYEGTKPDLNEYARFAADWTKHIPHVLSPNGSFWLNAGYTKVGDNETLPLTYLYYTVRPQQLRLIQEIVWEYPSGLAYKRRFAHRSERWQWWALNPSDAHFDLDAVRLPQTSRDKRNNPLGKNPTDVWRFNHVIKGTCQNVEATAHPCAFPLDMIRRVIRATSTLGHTLLDPFMGSGTTLVAAKELGRSAIGIEREEKYCEIAANRLRQARTTEALLAF